MANTKIKDVANKIPLGGNMFAEGLILGEAMKAGTGVYKSNATTIMKCDDPEICLGVLKEHEEFDLDTEITAGKRGDVVTKGNVAAFIFQDGVHYAGSNYMAAQFAAGKFRASGGVGSTAKLLKDIAADDDVAILRIL